jgi:hypothetical protein
MPEVKFSRSNVRHRPRNWAVGNVKVEDYHPSGKRFLLRFKENGGKEKGAPIHHKLEELLDQYLRETGLEKESESPFFQRPSERPVSYRAGSLPAPMLRNAQNATQGNGFGRPRHSR